MTLFEFKNKLSEVAWKSVDEILGNEEEFMVQVDVTNEGSEETVFEVSLFLNEERSLTLEPIRLCYCNVNLDEGLTFGVNLSTLFPLMNEGAEKVKMTLEEYVSLFARTLESTRAQIMLKNLIVNA